MGRSRNRTWRWSGAHPGPADRFLLIEVADSSLPTDRGAKRAIHAKSARREYGIVDLATNTVAVHRRPAGLAYTSVTTVTSSRTLTVEALPTLALAAASLFAWESDVTRL